MNEDPFSLVSDKWYHIVYSPINSQGGIKLDAILWLNWQWTLSNGEGIECADEKIFKSDLIVAYIQIVYQVIYTHIHTCQKAYTKIQTIKYRRKFNHNQSRFKDYLQERYNYNTDPIVCLINSCTFNIWTNCNM